MLDVGQVRKDTEKVQLRLRRKEEKKANFDRRLARVKAREAVKKLIPQIETKIKKAGREGKNSEEIFFYSRVYHRDKSLKDLVTEEVVFLLIKHFGKIKGLKISESDREDDCSAYYGTDIVVSW